MEIIQFLMQTLLESKAEHTDFVDYGLVKDVISLKQKSQCELIDLSSQATQVEQLGWLSFASQHFMLCNTKLGAALKAGLCSEDTAGEGSHTIKHQDPLCDVELCISLWLCWCRDV